MLDTISQPDIPVAVPIVFGVVCLTLFAIIHRAEQRDIVNKPRRVRMMRVGGPKGEWQPVTQVMADREEARQAREKQEAVDKAVQDVLDAPRRARTKIVDAWNDWVHKVNGSNPNQVLDYLDVTSSDYEIQAAERFLLSRVGLDKPQFNGGYSPLVDLMDHATHLVMNFNKETVTDYFNNIVYGKKGGKSKGEVIDAEYSDVD